MLSFCKETKEKITISLYVQPKAQKTELVGVHNHLLKIKVAALPAENEANKEVIHFFSKFLGIPKSNLRIIVGEHSREKVLEAIGITSVEFTRLLLKSHILQLGIG